MQLRDQFGIDNPSVPNRNFRKSYFQTIRLLNNPVNNRQLCLAEVNAELVIKECENVREQLLSYTRGGDQKSVYSYNRQNLCLAPYEGILKFFPCDPLNSNFKETEFYGFSRHNNDPLAPFETAENLNIDQLEQELKNYAEQIKSRGLSYLTLRRDDNVAFSDDEADFTGVYLFKAYEKSFVNANGNTFQIGLSDVSKEWHAYRVGLAI